MGQVPPAPVSSAHARLSRKSRQPNQMIDQQPEETWINDSDTGRRQERTVTVPGNGVKLCLCEMSHEVGNTRILLGNIRVFVAAGRFVCVAGGTRCSVGVHSAAVNTSPDLLPADTHTAVHTPVQAECAARWLP